MKVTILTANDLKGQSSFELYVRYNYKITGMSSDTVWYDEFEENYKKFCEKYRLLQEEIRAEDVA